VALLPRRTAIKRAAAGEHYQQQVIAANIDTVFVVCGLDADFNPRRIERYLLLVRGGGAEPVVVLTKSDKDGSDAEASLAALAELAAQGIVAVAVNAKDRASVAALEPWLGGPHRRAGGLVGRRQIHAHQHAARRGEDEDRMRSARTMRAAATPPPSAR
jgi:putative ribosome biogenesis GTPase RsgA